MTKEQILRRIGELLDLCNRGPDTRPDPHGVLTGALTLMEAVYRERSSQVDALLKRRDEVGKTAKSEMVRRYELMMAVKGALENLRDEINADLLLSIERRVTSDVLSDFVQLAQLALDRGDDGSKNVAAVLAAAAYEDTIRRIAREHASMMGQDKLDAVIASLKDAGLLVPPQLGIAISYLNFRNRALHAEWDKIDRASVVSVLGFVQELLLKHFS